MRVRNRGYIIYTSIGTKPYYYCGRVLKIGEMLYRDITIPGRVSLTKVMLRSPLGTVSHSLESEQNKHMEQLQTIVFLSARHVILKAAVPLLIIS